MKTRILFVDDEQRVLDGLRRSLRRYRSRWDTSFANGGEAAQQEFAKAPFDIVVSDMQMPGMDGYTLLSYIREEFPDTVRIILSGQTDQAAALKSVSVSHQFLAKPCEGEQLREVLDRACAVRDLCSSSHLRAAISRLGKLPSSPRIFLALMEVMAYEDTSSNEVADIVEQDMAMSAKLLQIVNSAYFGLPRTLASVREAVIFLGMGMIRSLVLSQEAFASFKPSRGFGGADLDREQRHGILTATVARELCEDPKLGEQASLAGMMHDIGVMIIATQSPKDLVKLGARPTHDAHDAFERGILGTTHAELGAYLLGTWGVPLRVTEAVAFHHNPMAVDHSGFDVITAVHVADALVSELTAHPSLVGTGAELNTTYLKFLGLTERLPEWRQQAEMIIAEAQENSDAA